MWESLGCFPSQLWMISARLSLKRDRTRVYDSTVSCACTQLGHGTRGYKLHPRAKLLGPHIVDQLKPCHENFLDLTFGRIMIRSVSHQLSWQTHKAVEPLSATH